jgi:integrase
MKLPEVVSKRSFSRDLKSIKNILLRLGETTKVKDITAGRVDGYRERRLQEMSSRSPGQTIKPATVNREVACLKTMVSRAVRHGLLRENSLLGYKMLTEDNVRMRTLDDERFEKLLDSCPLHVRPIVTVAYYLGMRKSEMVKLTWGEVDLQDGFIRLYGGRTKNKSGRSRFLFTRRLLGC